MDSSGNGVPVSGRLSNESGFASAHLRSTIRLQFFNFHRYIRWMLRRLWTLIIIGRKSFFDLSDLTAEESRNYMEWLKIKIIYRQTNQTVSYLDDLLFKYYMIKEIVTCQERLRKRMLRPSHQERDARRIPLGDLYIVENEDSITYLNKWLSFTSKWATVENELRCHKKIEYKKRIREEMWFENRLFDELESAIEHNSLGNIPEESSRKTLFRKILEAESMGIIQGPGLIQRKNTDTEVNKLLRFWISGEEAEQSNNEEEVGIEKDEVKCDKNEVELKVEDNLLVKSDVVESDVVKSDVVESDVVKSDVVESDVVKSDVVESDVVKSDVVESDVVKSDVVESDAFCIVTMPCSEDEPEKTSIKSDVELQEEDKLSVKSNKTYIISKSNDDIITKNSSANHVGVKHGLTFIKEEDNVSVKSNVTYIVKKRCKKVKTKKGSVVCCVRDNNGQKKIEEEDKVSVKSNATYVVKKRRNNKAKTQKDLVACCVRGKPGKNTNKELNEDKLSVKSNKTYIIKRSCKANNDKEKTKKGSVASSVRDKMRRRPKNN